MNVENHNLLIDKALLNKLSQEESLKFEELMNSNEFAQEFEFRKKILLASKIEGRKDLKAQFNLFDKEVKVRRLYPRKLWAAIAAAAILLIAAIFIIQMNTSQEDSLYTSHYDRLENSMVIIQRGENEMNELKKGFIAYNAKRYDEAAIIFSALIEEFPDLSVYQASIALENNEFMNAVELLEPIVLDKNAKYNTEAKWYLALAYLGLDQKEKVNPLINELSNQEGYYAKKAQALALDLHI